jgi:hypothetical protein
VPPVATSGAVTRRPASMRRLTPRRKNIGSFAALNLAKIGSMTIGPTRRVRDPRCLRLGTIRSTSQLPVLPGGFPTTGSNISTCESVCPSGMDSRAAEGPTLTDRPGTALSFLRGYQPLWELQGPDPKAQLLGTACVRSCVLTALVTSTTNTPHAAEPDRCAEVRSRRLPRPTR